MRRAGWRLAVPVVCWGAPVHWGHPSHCPSTPVPRPHPGPRAELQGCTEPPVGSGAGAVRFLGSTSRFCSLGRSSSCKRRAGWPLGHSLCPCLGVGGSPESLSPQKHGLVTAPVTQATGTSCFWTLSESRSPAHCPPGRSPGEKCPAASHRHACVRWSVALKARSHLSPTACRPRLPRYS